MPEPNARPKPFDDDNGMSETGIIILGPNDPTPESGSASNSFGSSIDSNFQSLKGTEPIEPSSNDQGTIFGRFFGSFSFAPTTNGEMCPGTSIEGNSLTSSSFDCSDYSSHSSNYSECSELSFAEKLFNFFVPEGVGSSICYDPTCASSVLPMYIDMGCDPKDANQM